MKIKPGDHVETMFAFRKVKAEIVKIFKQFNKIHITYKVADHEYTELKEIFSARVDEAKKDVTVLAEVEL